MSDEPAIRARQDSRGERGLTLVEMLLVVFILAAVAAAATELVGDLDDQGRYSDTRDRLQLMRSAIVGRPDRTVNGEPDLTSFVADMGRLPTHLFELTTPILPTYTSDPTTGSGAGWRGPYLSSTPEASGLRAFRDGWANKGSGDDALDFGWVVTTGVDALGVSSLEVQSLGSDGTIGGDTTYTADFPAAGTGPLVTSADWSLDLSALQASIVGPVTTTSINVILRLSYPSDGVLTTHDFGPVTVSGTAGLFARPFVFASEAASIRVPIGAHAVALLNADGTALSGNTSAPERVLFAPRALSPSITIYWPSP